MSSAVLIAIDRHLQPLAVSEGWRRNTGLWRWQLFVGPIAAHVHPDDISAARHALFGRVEEVRVGDLRGWEVVRLRGSRTADGYVLSLKRVDGPLDLGTLWVPWSVYRKQPYAPKRRGPLNPRAPQAAQLA